jgi:hypothetical protein
MAIMQSRLGGEGWGQLSRPKKTSFRRFLNIWRYFFHPPLQMAPNGIEFLEKFYKKLFFLAIFMEIERIAIQYGW